VFSADDLASALLVLACALLVGAVAITGGIWRSEERLRSLLSYLLFLRSRRRLALAFFTGMILAAMVALLIGTVSAVLAWDPVSLDIAENTSIAVAAGCVFLLAFYALRERTLSEGDRAVLRAGHYSMYTQFGEEAMPSSAEVDDLPIAYPVVPRPPRAG
jgi:hypothetical protein